MRATRAVVIGLCLLVCLSAMSCAPGTKAPKKLTVVEGTAITTLSAHHSTATPDRHVHILLYQTLVKLDSRQNIVGDLAESWSSTPDGLSMTFKLKKNYKFSDGTPVDAEAVKYNIEKFPDKNYGHVYRSLYEVIAGAEVIDPYTVKIVTKQPFSPLLASLCIPSAAIQSPAAIEKWGKEYAQHPVGSGPYMLKELGTDYVRLERNPYWPGPKGYWDEIVQRAVPEASARAAMLQTGEADIVVKIAPEDVTRLQGNPDFAIQVLPSMYQISFEINTRKPPFTDVRVRKALNYAVDRQAIVDNILQGLGDVAVSAVGPGQMYRKTFPPYPYDITRTKALLTEAGLPDGFKAKLWAPSGRYLKDKETAEAVQQYLAKAGVTTDLRIWEWAPYGEVTKGIPTAETERELFMMGRAVFGADYMMYRLWYSTSTMNVTGYVNPRVDELLAGARTTFDTSKQREMYEEVQRIVFQEDPPFLWLHSQKQIVGVRKGITGLVVQPTEWLELRDVKGS
ncbi:MAG: hypothetical protein K6T75_06720 [Acetobacteraceae bacterium]|nr:hypothetical protein [Acetobacteraceae bacterium]